MRRFGLFDSVAGRIAHLKTKYIMHDVASTVKTVGVVRRDNVYGLGFFIITRLCLLRYAILLFVKAVLIGVKGTRVRLENRLKFGVSEGRILGAVKLQRGKSCVNE